jgi:hypothetical protein
MAGDSFIALLRPVYLQINKAGRRLVFDNGYRVYKAKFRKEVRR